MSPKKKTDWLGGTLLAIGILAFFIHPAGVLPVAIIYLVAKMYRLTSAA